MLNTILTNPITITQLLICMSAALAFGVLSSMVFQFKQTPRLSFTVTLALLPLAMSMIVIMINGNLGIAVAVAGSFALVRFRSIAGSGREISAIFVDMTLGVIIGVGCIGVAVIFFAFAALIFIAVNLIGIEKSSDRYLRITIPEDYDYNGLFDDVFGNNNVRFSLERVKSANMGSLIELTYKVSLPNGEMPKAMFNEIRQKNANLAVMLYPYVDDSERL